MKVHKDFKIFCENIQKTLKEQNKKITLIEITKLIRQHNSIEIIKGDILNLKK